MPVRLRDPGVETTLVQESTTMANGEQIETGAPASEPEECGGKKLESLGRAESQVNRVGVTFILLCAYLGVAAAATSHRDLVIGRTLVLPLLDIQLPVRPFYAIAPVLVVLVHLNLLITEILFQEKADAATSDLQGTKLVDLMGVALPVRSLIDRISSDPWLNHALRLMFFVVNLAIPLGVLLLLQAQFMPLHHKWIGRMLHPAVVTVDLMLIAFLVPRILSPDSSWRGWWRLGVEPSIGQRPPQWHKLRRRFAFGAKVLLCVTLMIVVGAVTWAGLRTPRIAANDDQAIDCDPLLPFGVGQRTGYRWSDLPWPRRHLSLANDTKSFDSKIRLINQDLLCADFSGLNLDGADLRGSDLRRARLERTSFRGADLSPAPRRQHDGANTGRRTNLSFAHAEKADFSGADLERINLRNASLREARFSSALLEGADLSDAHLEDADLDRAQLQNATLDRIHARRASLAGAQLDGATVQAADLGQVVATCASLRRARLQLSVLFDARLDFADLSEAQALGANLRRASLGAAVGLTLHDVSLEGAMLKGFSPVPSPGTARRTAHLDSQGITPKRTDFEGAFWDRPTVTQLREILEDYAQSLHSPPDDGPTLPTTLKDGECAVATEGWNDEQKTVKSGLVEIFPLGIGRHAFVGPDASFFSRYPLVQQGVRLHAFDVSELGTVPTRQEVDALRARTIVRWACQEGARMNLLLHRFIEMESNEDNALADAVLHTLLTASGEGRPPQLSTSASVDCPALREFTAQERDLIRKRYRELRFEVHHSQFTGGERF